MTPDSTARDTLPLELNLPLEKEQNMDPLDFCNPEKFIISPRKILLIGTMGSGKTTVAEHLARDTGFSYASIDACRMKFGDGTMDGEDLAWDHFLGSCANPLPAILEFSGCGPHADEVHYALRDSGVPVTIVWLVLPVETCIIRALLRKKNVPAPYLWAPIESAIPVFHDAIGDSWERTWSREPAFQALRQEFSGSDSAFRIYSDIRKSCLSLR